MKYGGYTGKFLTVDLGTGEFGALPLSDELAEKYVGGRGFVAKLLYDRLPRGIDPLGPENVIVFATGPATGTMIPTASRIAVGVKSPLTGTISASYMGGHFGPELKYAGWDGIIITGVSQKPVTLVIDDDKVDCVDAAHLWGKDTLETQEQLAEELGDDFRTRRHRPGGREPACRTPPSCTCSTPPGAAAPAPSSAARSSRRWPSAAPAASRVAAPPGGVHRRLQGAARHHHGEPGPAGLPLGRHDRACCRSSTRSSACRTATTRTTRCPTSSPIHNEEIAKYVKHYEACSGCNVICGSVVEFERNGRALPLRAHRARVDVGARSELRHRRPARPSWRPTTCATCLGIDTMTRGVDDRLGHGDDPEAAC